MPYIKKNKDEFILYEEGIDYSTTLISKIALLFEKDNIEYSIDIAEIILKIEKEKILRDWCCLQSLTTPSLSIVVDRELMTILDE